MRARLPTSLATLPLVWALGCGGSSSETPPPPPLRMHEPQPPAPSAPSKSDAAPEPDEAPLEQMPLY